jgi:hypothetical protein
MGTASSIIDRVYEIVIQFSMRFVNVYYKEQDAEVFTLPLETLRETEEDVLEDEAPYTFKTIEDILRAEPIVKSDAVKNTLMYARNIDVPVYRNPTIEFDSQVGTIPYGEMVMMLEPKGRFYNVVWNSLQGWVLKEDLADRAAYVYPEFLIGEENGIDHPNTAHVRALLRDTFNTRHTDFPLQAGEYVLYKLWKKGKYVNWPRSQEPRVPGLWHKILRGVPQVHIGVVPKIDAVMEYMMTNEIGHVAYVEAVFPDDTITISEANYPDSGIYNERVLMKEEWKELRPTFISVQ